jgi:Phytanoyl-CoA dioxygenase (PhyH)
MDDWLSRIQSAGQLEAGAERELREAGFVVIPGVVAGERVDRLALAYDTAVAEATPSQLRTGSDTTRVHGLVDGGPEFDEVYLYLPMLEVSRRLIGQALRLSSLLARTVRPWSRAQPLHVDAPADADGWPMVGFILMVDAFRIDNGSTRFVPGSHRGAEVRSDADADQTGQVLALGARGSMVIYNGSVWHGHSANRTAAPRRSIQGAYVRRNGPAAVGCRPDTEARLGGLARYLLGIGE